MGSFDGRICTSRTSSRCRLRDCNRHSSLQLLLMMTTALAILCARTTSAFVPVVVLKHCNRTPPPPTTTTTCPGRHFTRQSSSSLFALPDISGMKAGEIRSELESYGINTKAFLEKTELVAALEKARAQGKTPMKENTKTPTEAKSSTSSSTTTTSSSSSSSNLSRDERIKQEMEKAAAMKVADLKKELQARGISTRSFFEKSEFVKAYAEAIVDGKEPINGTGNRQTASSSSSSATETFDPEYRDVVMQKMSRGDPRLLQGTVIDVTPKRA